MPNDSYYQSKEHLVWREKVLRRAKYLCQECSKYGRYKAATHAHHIQPRSVAPELSRVVSNGMALCTECHNKLEPRSTGWKSQRSQSNY